MAATAFALHAGLSFAQTSGDAADLCATSPAELLAALDGTWTLNQGPGWAAAGGGAIGTPLPAHPPQQIQIALDPNLGLPVLSAQGQHMMMVPAEPEPVAEHIDSVIEETGSAGAQSNATDCDWYGLPPIIGTNMYSLDGPGVQTPDLSALAGAGWPDADGHGSFSLAFYVCPGTLPDRVYQEMDNEGVFPVGDVDVRFFRDDSRREVLPR